MEQYEDEDRREAWRDGWAAFAAGREVSVCPYSGPYMREAWRSGWGAAQVDYYSDMGVEAELADRAVVDDTEQSGWSIDPRVVPLLEPGEIYILRANSGELWAKVAIKVLGAEPAGNGQVGYALEFLAFLDGSPGVLDKELPNG